VNFGAFVDLGGMDGLVHVSELSWKHVDHPSSVVAVGDEVTVQVLDVDLDKERISLSLKATQVDPWQEFATNHRIGELVYGRITKLVPFGAFVQVGDGIEGLVHISEMAAHHVDLPEQVVTPGEELWVKIIDIDLQRRRISLSIKQAAEGGEVAAEYREAFGEHAYDEHGNYIGAGYTAFEPESEAQAAWAGYLEEQAHAQAVGGATATSAEDTATEVAAELVDEALVAEATAVVEVAAAAEAVAAAEAALGEEAALDDEIAELGVDAVEEAALEEDAAAEEPAAAESPAATPPRATAKAKETASEEGPGTTSAG
jgi:small subunit ribosomal protein S1